MSEVINMDVSVILFVILVIVEIIIFILGEEQHRKSLISGVIGTVAGVAVGMMI